MPTDRDLSHTTVAILCTDGVEQVELTRPWNDPGADFDRALGGPSSTVLGALDDRRLVGTVMVGHDGHRGWVYYLASSPTRRGLGIGRELMAAAERWLEAREVPKLELMVRTSNADVVSFYERLGYGREDVVVMSRWLVAQKNSPMRSGGPA